MKACHTIEQEARSTAQVVAWMVERVRSGAPVDAVASLAAKLPMTKDARLYFTRIGLETQLKQTLRSSRVAQGLPRDARFTVEPIAWPFTVEQSHYAWRRAVLDEGDGLTNKEPT